jgi:hypothetical protein
MNTLSMVYLGSVAGWPLISFFTLLSTYPMSLQDLPASKLRQAATIKDQIERLTKELNTIFGLSAKSSAVPTKNGMSASARRKIAAAQRARWVALRREKTAASTKPAAKKKTMSPATRAKLRAKLKAYWRAKKAGK